MTYIVVDYVPTGVAHLLLMAYLLFDVMVDVSFEPLIRLYSGSPSLIMFHMHLISGSMIHFLHFTSFFGISSATGKKPLLIRILKPDFRGVIE